MLAGTRSRRAFSNRLWFCIAAGAAVIVLGPLPAQAAANYTYASTGMEITDGTQDGWEVACASDGDRAISGGFDSNATYDEGIYLNSSRPGTLGQLFQHQSWTFWADNYNFVGDSPSITATIYAVCDVGGDDDYIASVGGDHLVPDDTQSEVFTIDCSDGVAVGGGGSSSGVYGDETYLTTSTPGDGIDHNEKPDDGWSFALNNDEGGAGTNTVTGYVLCDTKRKPSAYDQVRRTRNVPDGTQQTLKAPCANGQTLVGGGVQSKSRYKHGLYINSSYPGNGGKWVAAVDNYATPDGDARKMVVTAICKR